MKWAKGDGGHLSLGHKNFPVDRFSRTIDREGGGIGCQVEQKERCQAEPVEASLIKEPIFVFMKLNHNYYVYIVECSDKSYYTGVTNDVDRRVEEHNAGENPASYTYQRRPVVLKYCEHFFHIEQAISWEKKLKGWSRRKKEALFKDDWEEIKKLARNREDPSTGSG